MKKILLIALLALTASCGTIKYFTPPPPVERIITLDSDKNDTYIRANEWMVEVFNHAKHIIQFSDKENGIIKGRYEMHSAPTTLHEDVNVVITVKVKDGAAKISIDPSNSVFWDYTNGKSDTHSEGMVTGFRPSQFKDKADILIQSFKIRMNETKDIF